jgi:hypothetical protein
VLFVTVCVCFMSFMAPMSRFGIRGCGPVQAAREFKEMVRT